MKTFSHKILVASIFLLAVFTLLIFSPSAYGQEAGTTTTTTPGMAERKERIENRIEGAKEKLDERRETIEERKAALSDRIQNRITNLANNVSRLMNSAITRLENILGRIETRAEKLTERDIDTEEAFGFIAQAEISIGVAKSALSSIDVLVESAITSEKPREDFKVVREQFLEAKAALHEAREHTRSAVASLKSALSDSDLGRGVSDAVSNSSTTEDVPEEVE